MKKLKGFTLIELIIVMAILSILMIAIMQMFKPIRSTYVDATMYEKQRTAQNGMIQYISESVRYATDMGLYTKDKKGSVTAAVDAFADAYIAANNLVDVDPTHQYKTNAKKAIQCYAEVIIIDKTTDYTFNNVKWKGRILRRKFIDAASGSTYKYKPITANAEDYKKTEECRIAMGASYYGDRNYTVNIKCGNPKKYVLDSKGKPTETLKTGETWKADDGIMLTVASYSKAQRSGAAVTEKGAYVETKGDVLCKNLAGTSGYGIAKAGVFDIANFNSAAPSGNNTIYIVYLNPGKDGIDAVRTAAGLPN